MKRVILIVGGAGNVGAALAEKLMLADAARSAASHGTDILAGHVPEPLVILDEGRIRDVLEADVIDRAMKIALNPEPTKFDMSSFRELRQTKVRDWEQRERKKRRR